MIRLMTQAEIDRHLELVLAYPSFQKSGLKVADIKLFKAAGALTIVALAEVYDDPVTAPAWAQPFAAADTPLLVPRAMILCHWFGPAGYAAWNASDLAWEQLPLQPADDRAWLFLTIVNSTARNGIARLAIALSDAVETHLAAARLQSLIWYVRTIKGQAMNEYFHGQPTGTFMTRQRPDEPAQVMPIYEMPRAGWRAQVDGMLEKLMGFEDQFTDELTQLHLQLLGKVPS